MIAVTAAANPAVAMLASQTRRGIAPRGRGPGEDRRQDSRKAPCSAGLDGLGLDGSGAGGCPPVPMLFGWSLAADPPSVRIGNPAFASNVRFGG
ncbi:hypothetical protein BCD49_24565 [Pseudofrankia sp. EUN1h]|nr:hypothetical protein BCD49_24565 [Pseudofrankia sp. EUN1h]